jgi:hypothetical protein
MRNASENHLPKSAPRHCEPTCQGNLLGLGWHGWLLPLMFAWGAVLVWTQREHSIPASADWELALTNIPFRQDAVLVGKFDELPLVVIEGMPMRTFGIERRGSTETGSSRHNSSSGENRPPEWLLVSLPYSETSDDHLRQITDRSRVRSLVLDGTRITDAGLEHVRGMANLETLCLGATEITDAGVQSLDDLQALQFLDLRRTRVTNASIPSLSRLRRLGLLNLSETNVDGAGLIPLQDLEHLETILLNDTSLDDGDVPALCRLTSLRRISVRGTCISKSGIAELARLPGLVFCEFDGGTLYRRELDALRRRED